MIPRFKYPRTLHLPQSPGYSTDDKVLVNIDHLLGKEVIFTEKMDGECTTLYGDYYSHARSLDSRHHTSRDWVKRFHGQIAHHIRDRWRLCGENLYAQHALVYNELESYFYAFSLWNNHNNCVHWDEFKQFCERAQITMVPELWRGLLTECTIREVISLLDLNRQEGFVMRLVDEFHYTDFSQSVAKYVRLGHVQTDAHWQHQAIIPNKLKNKIPE